VAQLYPRALGSLFIASYDSRGYGGGILTRLHTGNSNLHYILNILYSYAYSQENTESSTVIGYVFVPAETCIESRCLATIEVYTDKEQGDLRNVLLVSQTKQSKLNIKQVYMRKK
jgi:hypothetical protein